ncbi:MAG: DUF309 domain-containing protein [Actinobacteria bacterium]|nr:DUF309 domain-containing protein [Actinomycetota bacterium]
MSDDRPRDVRRFDRDRDAAGRPENARPRDLLGQPLPYGTERTDLARDWEYDTVEEALATGVELWNHERYFEAHECLEDVWHRALDPDRLFWQGVIQVAVACCHHQRGNADGASALFDRAADKLEAYPDVHHGVDVEQLRVFARGAAEAVRQAGFTVEIGYPEFPAMDDGPWFERGAAATPLGRSDERRTT